jgi:hypothetical protein
LNVFCSGDHSLLLKTRKRETRNELAARGRISL